VPPSPLTVPEAKNDPVLRRFPLRRLRMPLGSGSMDLVVPDAAAWLRQGDWTGPTLRGAEPPYWVQIWPAAVAMARLLARVGTLAGLRALDLGCGVGVPGIAAGRMGASITFADRQVEALAFAGWNGARQPGAAAPTLHQLDWARDVVPGTFDLILLSDVSYRPVHHAALRQRGAALAPEGIVLHADPLRRESTPFVQWLGQQYAACATQRRTTFLDRTLDIRLCVASRSPQAIAKWRQAMGLAVDSVLVATPAPNEPTS
jgi:SAM-dependent methyltransferase